MYVVFLPSRSLQESHCFTISFGWLVWQALQTLLVYFHPDSPAIAQASLNFVRCAMSARGLAALQIIINSVGPGWCFTLFAVYYLGTIPLLWMESEWGMEWRLAKGSVIRGEEELLLPP
jgi:hypothetical protein